MDAAAIAVIVLVSLVALLSLALVILWWLDSRITAKQNALDKQKQAGGVKQSRLVKEEVYLRVKGGRAGVLRELPVKTVVVEQPQPQPPAPIIEEYKEEFTGGLANMVIPESPPLPEEEAEEFVNAEPVKQPFTVALNNINAFNRSLYNMFAAYMQEISNVTAENNVYDVTYRYFKRRIVRAEVSGGAVVLKFYLFHKELARAISAEDAAGLKAGVSNITLTSEKGLAYSKHMVKAMVKEVNACIISKCKRLKK